ncbi:MAG: HlyD family efflux transporter periplasmic adaptor subunit [Phycisphaera sp.]|nr:HlyD family efflux transporter periplasmic adaptor subunit [Phycisphaera sp.]
MDQSPSNGGSRQSSEVFARPIGYSSTFPVSDVTQQDDPALRWQRPTNGDSKKKHDHPALPPGATPVAKRPKGRWFVGGVIIVVALFITYEVWTAYFRYRAMGVVEAQVLNLSPRVDGVIEGLYAAEGEHVKKGQLLAKVTNVDLQYRYEAATDELKIAKANLLAAAAQLKWQSARYADNFGEASTDYYDLWSRLEQEKSNLQQAQIELDRISDVYKASAATYREMELLKNRRDGLTQRVEKLTQAVEEARKRVDNAKALSESDPDALAPLNARIETLNSELVRLRQQLAQTDILSPVEGTVIHHLKLAGERADPTQPLMTLEAQQTTEVVLYVPQAYSRKLNVGDTITLEVRTFGDRVKAKVLRIEDRWTQAPDSIARQYLAGESLLPIHVGPVTDSEPTDATKWSKLRVGEVVRLPSRWNPW